MNRSSGLLAALLLGIAGGMGQNFQSQLFGYVPGGRSSSGGPRRFRTRAGHMMQSFRCKKDRNIKGLSR